MVLKDILIKLRDRGEYFENIISIQPTSPFLSILTLKKMVNIFSKKRATGVASIEKIKDFHPLTAQKKDKNGKLSFLTKPKNYKMLFPRQNRPDSFKFTGGAYLRKSKNILNYQGDGWALGNNPYGVVVSDEEALDINYREDLLKIQHSWKR